MKTALACSAIALVGALCASIALGSGAARLSIRAARGYVEYGQHVVLSGTASTGDRPLGRAKVTIEAQVFPFQGSFEAVTVGLTNSKGRYRIAVAPTLATRYKASIGGGQSNSLIVTEYVVPRDEAVCNLCAIATGPGAHELIVGDVYEVPPGTPAITGPEYFYYGQTNGSTAVPATLRLVTTAPVTQITPTRLRDTIRYRVHFPKERSTYRYLTCFKTAEAQDGIGLPGNHHCGAPRLTRAERTHYVG